VRIQEEIQRFLRDEDDDQHQRGDASEGHGRDEAGDDLLPYLPPPRRG
jgi:hypothetical protein